MNTTPQSNSAPWSALVKSQQSWLLLALLGIGALIFFVGPSLSTLPALGGLSWQGWLAIVITLVAFLLNAFTPLAPEVIFLGGLAVLLLSGTLTTKDALGGFSNSGMITVGVLYVVVTGLQQTGGMERISQMVLGLPKGTNSALIRLLAPVTLLSAILNNTPVVAMFIPVVNSWCRKLGISPSKLMIPLSYGAIMGGTCTLIGTSTNLVVNGLLISETDYPGLDLFAISWIGVPCAIAGCIFLVLTHSFLLPERKPALSDDDDPRKYTAEMVVEANSPLAGKTVEQAGLRQLPGLYLAEIQRDSQLLTAINPKETLREKDQLVFVGVVDSIIDLKNIRGLQPATDQVFKLDAPSSERCLIEAVVSNSCPLVGSTIREGAFRSQYGAVVLAVARDGDRLPGKIGDIRLQAGDTLLLEAPPTFVEQRRGSRDFYLVSSIPDSEPLRHDKALIAVVILVLMVVLAVWGWDMLNAAVLAAVLMLITGCCSPARAFKNIDWSVLLVIAAAFGIGKALETTGAAQVISTTMLSLAGDSPWVSLVVIYGVTLILTELVTNNAAAALIFPVALALSKTLDVSFIPFVIVIMMAASAGFATPIGYQTHLMVYGPGGYKFTDFLRIGIPFDLLFYAITIALTPIFFPF